MTADRFLFWLMRLNAAVLCLAAPFALLPFSWMESIHRDVLGMGSLPDQPIARYMARSLSLVYATYGLITLYITLDWTRYRPAVPFLAWLHIAFGGAMFLIDIEAGLPWWWIAGEGPPLIGMGMLMLFVYGRASRDNPAVL